MFDKNTGDHIDLPEFERRVSQHDASQIFVKNPCNLLFGLRSIAPAAIRTGNKVTGSNFNVNGEEDHNSLALYLDCKIASHFFSRLKKDFTTREYEKIILQNVFILIDDHVLGYGDVLESNFPVSNIGMLASEVLSARYNVPISSLSRDFSDKESFTALVSAIQQFTIESDFKQRLVIDVDDSKTNNYRSTIMPVVFHSGSSKIDHDLIHASGKYASCVEYSSDGVKVFTPYFRYTEGSEPFGFEEVFNVGYFSVMDVLRKNVKYSSGFSAIDVYEFFKAQTKVGGRIVNVNYVVKALYEYCESLDPTIGQVSMSSVLSLKGVKSMNNGNSGRNSFSKESEAYKSLETIFNFLNIRY